VKRFPPSHRGTVFAFVAGLVLVGATFGEARADAASSPFLPPGTEAAPAAAPATGRLERLELSGVMTLGGRVEVCLADRDSGRSFWLVVGESRDGLRAEDYDLETDAVLVRAGDATRWIRMREASIQNAPVWYLSDGSVDWLHMQMTDEEKVQEASMMMWDILEIGRLKRAGKLGRRSTGSAP